MFAGYQAEPPADVFEALVVFGILLPRSSEILGKHRFPRRIQRRFAEAEAWGLVETISGWLEIAGGFAGGQ